MYAGFVRTFAWPPSDEQIRMYNLALPASGWILWCHSYTIEARLSGQVCLL